MTTSTLLGCLGCLVTLRHCVILDADHQKQLARWWNQKQKATANYPAAKLPALAKIPFDKELANESCLNCLLRNKWVQHRWSHSGMVDSTTTHEFLHIATVDSTANV